MQSRDSENESTQTKFKTLQILNRKLCYSVLSNIKNRDTGYGQTITMEFPPLQYQLHFRLNKLRMVGYAKER